MLSVDHSNIDGLPLAVKCVRKFGSVLGGEVVCVCARALSIWMSRQFARPPIALSGRLDFCLGTYLDSLLSCLSTYTI